MANFALPISKRRLALTYVALVGLPVAILLAVVAAHGVGPAPIHVPPSVPIPVPTSAPRQSAANGMPNLVLLVAQLTLIILATRAVGWLAERIRQPRVTGELLAGILLGPSLLGWLAPGLSGLLFPPASFGILNALSQLGLVLFMFMVGLELNVNDLRRQGPSAVLISHASIAAPMALGALLALYLYPRLSDPSVKFAGFALFMGAAMSVTAFPVLARILSERKLLHSRLGTMAIACAAIDDVTGWCVLACIVAQVRAGESSIPVWMTVAGLAAFLALMLLVARKPLAKIERAYLARGELTDNLKALLLLVLMMSALVTEFLGLHLLFGAFIAGAIMPKNRQFVAYLIGRFESLTVLMLLPLFFAYTGLRTSIGQVRGMAGWWLCGLIVAVAVAGKLGGTSLTARLGGSSWRDSLALGALMNTRGLMELVVLNIGLDIKVISPSLYSMLVVMAVATTMMTPPLLHWFYPPGRE
ncbi:MAG TPA: cation:proton antiporter [Candidatus Acidoferrales bacterium]|nr:cation:proton antiporter [Candidatus Acidoferrales bacterium]